MSCVGLIRSCEKTLLAGTVRCGVVAHRPHPAGVVSGTYLTPKLRRQMTPWGPERGGTDSSRICGPPSPRTARKVSTVLFVFRDTHGVALKQTLYRRGGGGRMGVATAPES